MPIIQVEQYKAALAAHEGIWRRVILESPWRATSRQEYERNLAYARACINDCLQRNESPYASHIMLAPGLVETDQEQRLRGIAAGFEWHQAASLQVVYIDLGMTDGMARAVERASARGLKVEFRRLRDSGKDWVEFDRDIEEVF